MHPILVLRFLISIALVSVADTAVKKKVEDVMPIATGHEREELESELQAIFFPFPGKKILEDVNNPVGPFGTKVSISPSITTENPNLIMSVSSYM
ncbi:hypothetical protein Golob_003661 [Gossypium lobatum]|uniref:Uncharacterized protein n=1 Tax=Gossypium lobatum TaxID=34289 RepID=A0A7J8MZH3_9ROSI|nr:hypothetical protein [Gossypium lobatum]